MSRSTTHSEKKYKIGVIMVSKERQKELYEIRKLTKNTEDQRKRMFDTMSSVEKYRCVMCRKLCTSQEELSEHLHYYCTGGW